MSNMVFAKDNVADHGFNRRCINGVAFPDSMDQPVQPMDRDPARSARQCRSSGVGVVQRQADREYRCRQNGETVQNLLDMTSGIRWQEKHYTPDETIMRMYQAPDRTAFVLDQPMANAPGTTFYYDSGNPYVLSAIITRRTGMNAWDYAKETLFGPLGITTARWRKTG